MFFELDATTRLPPKPSPIQATGNNPPLVYPPAPLLPRRNPATAAGLSTIASDLPTFVLRIRRSRVRRFFILSPAFNF